MAEYIEREAAIKRMEELHFGCKDFHICGGVLLELNALKAIPAADVRPVERGNWTRFDYVPVGHDYECSKCGYMNDMMSNYCPNCGADMREVEHD